MFQRQWCWNSYGRSVCRAVVKVHKCSPPSTLACWHWEAECRNPNQKCTMVVMNASDAASTKVFSPSSDQAHVGSRGLAAGHHQGCRDRHQLAASAPPYFANVVQPTSLQQNLSMRLSVTSWQPRKGKTSKFQLCPILATTTQDFQA